MKSPAAKRSIAPIDINNISPSPVSGPYAGSTSSMINSSVVIGVGVAVGRRCRRRGRSRRGFRCVRRRRCWGRRRYASVIYYNDSSFTVGYSYILSFGYYLVSGNGAVLHKHIGAGGEIVPSCISVTIGGPCGYQICCRYRVFV